MIDLMKMHTVNKGDATKAEEYQQKLVSIMQLLEDQKHLKFKNSSVLCEELNNKVNYQLKQSINLLRNTGFQSLRNFCILFFLE